MADLPHRIEIVPWGFWKSVTGLNGRSQASSNLGGGSLFLTANPNSVTWEVLLDAGTWALDVIYGAGTNRGIAAVTLGGTSIGSIDMYAGGAAVNTVSTITGITVAAAGWYNLTLDVTTKNGSSSAYQAAYQFITLRRTGA